MMKLVIGSVNIKPIPKYPVVAIGNFDGLHLGHQAILSETTKRAREKEGTSVALTFEPHPIKVLYPEKGFKLLNPFQVKMRLIENAGIDVGFVAEFNNAFAECSPEAFARTFLQEKIGCREVIVGKKFRFGKDRAGSIDDLIRFGKTYGFEVVPQEPVLIDGITVSSSQIRRCIQEGDVGMAARMLGTNYMVEGKVVPGDGEGEASNYPTANIPLPNEVTPKDGIYAVHVDFFKGKDYGTLKGVAYIGSKPTFENRGPRVEVHLFDFNQNLYEQRIRITFIEHIRDDMRFEDPKDLLVQIGRDVDTAKSILQRL
ncbi:MAG: bifunctional riboflavin kinase/FAD synthetase [Nitrospiria bacterium]